MKSILCHLPRIREVIRKQVYPASSFEALSSMFAGEIGTVVLLSGSDLDCARYNILAVRPWLTLKTKGMKIEIKYAGQETFSLIKEPFDALHDLIEHFNIEIEAAATPVLSGFFGYLSYDLKDRIEALPITCMDNGLPEIFLVVPSFVLVQDRQENITELMVPVLEENDSSHAPFDKAAGFDDVVGWIRSARADCLNFIGSLENAGAGPPARPFMEKAHSFAAPKFHAGLGPSGDDGSAKFFSGDSIETDDGYCKSRKTGFSVNAATLKSNFSKSDYLAAVERVIEYIKAGDIYQVNLSQKFSADFKGNPFDLFLALFHKNPAPFFAFINAGDHHIISTSPERFMKQEKSRLETRPIKGTLPRAADSEKDRENADRLINSKKDDAELSMIVDLMRNDLGRIARGGSVRVKEHKRLEPYDNVFHLVSVVEAELADNKTSVDVIKASFPGGSITGCPKIRAMEIIDELETDKRHVYTGSIGYISFHDTMDLSIAIRTATIADDTIWYSVGGGIVFDSVPEKEYEETLDKGRTIMDILAESGKTSNVEGQEQVWINGGFVDKTRAFVPADLPGFQYGAGIFETIRVERGIPMRLSNHLNRFNASWKMLFQSTPPDITWDVVIREIIRKNGLENCTAAVKIIGMPGKGREITRNLHALNSDVICVFSRKYVHRLSLIGKKGLDLITFPFPRYGFLADHKTMNYLHYQSAAGFAADHGGDEALILNPDGTVSETNTCSIMAVIGKNVIIPDSDHVLPGVMINTIIEKLIPLGYNIQFKKIYHDEFYRLENIVVTNALMGAVPVLSIDNQAVVHTEDISCMLNDNLGIGQI